MTENSTNNCTLCMLIPLVLGIGTLLIFYFISRDGIANDIQNDLAFNSNQLLKEKHVGNATVTMDGRDAQLKGTVTSIERSQEIESILMKMPGIRSVNNQLEIVEKNVAQVVLPKPIEKPKVTLTPDPKPKTEVTTATSALKQEKEVNSLIQTLDLSGITFLFGNDEISEEGKLILDEIISILSQHTMFDVAIHGHTDNIGDDELNLQLSQQRAESVLNYLINNGIAAHRLSAIGYGESNPIADNNTKTGRAINRRIEFAVAKIQ